MIHSICGLQNAGKTLYMTYLAFKDFQKGKKIISNYNLNFKHYLVNKEFVFWVARKQPNFKNCSFVFDELWLWLDSNSDYKENRIATYFFLQSSKNDANIFLTAQSNDQNIKRIRKNLHRYTECNRVLKFKNKYYPVRSEKRDLGELLNQRLYIKLKTYDKNVTVSTREEGSFNLKDIKYLKANKYFTFFNTREKKVIV